MPCYARACRRVRPCPSQALCEKSWHLCAPPSRPGVGHWRCPRCKATWTQPTSGLWQRDPLEG